MSLLWKLIDLFLFIQGKLAGAGIDNDEQASNNGQGLEKFVFQEVPVGIAGWVLPELINEHIVKEQQYCQHERSELGVVADDDGGTSGKSHENNDDSEKGKFSREYESQEQ